MRQREFFVWDVWDLEESRTRFLNGTHFEVGKGARVFSRVFRGCDLSFEVRVCTRLFSYRLLNKLRPMFSLGQQH